MRRASVWQYHIPMDAGVVLRDRRIKQRDGLIVKLSENGNCGFGEIAPLPGFSIETLEEAQIAVMQWLETWLLGQDSPLPELPSVAFGLSCAQAELDGSLPKQGNYHIVPLCSGDPDEVILALADLPGEKIAKVKIGEYEAVRDGMIVNLLLEAIPDLSLRLDTNRRWTPKKGEQFAKYVNPAVRSRIAFIEEPCQTRDQSRAFSRDTGIAIAWDESLREEGFTFMQEPGVTAVVIKPSLTGSLDKVREQVIAAQKLGQTAVISSSLESSLGLTQLARIAAWMTPNVTPGLDTLSLMCAQAVREWPNSTLPCLPLESLEQLK